MTCIWSDSWRMLAMIYCKYSTYMDRCKTLLYTVKKANIWETPVVFRWRSDYIKGEANCVSVVRKQAEKKERKMERKNETRSTCGSHVSPSSSLLLCRFAYRAAHERRSSPDKQWTDESLDAWGCCQRKSEKKSNATLNTQLVFTGREQECKECLPSEFVPEWKVLIKCVPGNLWNCLHFRGWMLGIPNFLYPFTDSVKWSIRRMCEMGIKKPHTDGFNRRADICSWVAFQTTTSTVNCHWLAHTQTELTVDFMFTGFFFARILL